MKKLFTLFVVVICVMNASANEPDFQVGDFYYKIISSNEVELVNPSSEIGWHSTSLHSPNEYSDLTVANIPADVEYDGSIYNVTTIENYAFHDSDDLREITIPWTVTDIGEYAFSGCMIIRDKFINYSTLDAAWNNYWGATLLDEVDGLLINYLENVVVKCITDAASVTIPEGLTFIADGAFQECTKLTNITIPNSITYIGYWAFRNCSSLTSVTIPNSVTSIGDGAFQNCSSLTSITIPNSVTSIGYSAFYGCASLSSITIPENVEEIMSDAFGDCWFTEANFVNNSNLNAEENHYWGARFFDQEIGGLLIENDTLVGARNYITIANIPEIVKVIVGNVFYNCKQLVSITIPNSVTDIYSWAFNGCSIVRNNFVNHSSLNAQDNDYWGALIADVEIDGLLIRNDTVVYCRENVTSVTIPNSVTSIGNSAFYGCSSLTSVTIPNSVTSIGDGAFQNCSSLTSITIPNSVTSIGEAAFIGCFSLPSITIPNSVTSIGARAFYSCSSLTSITIPNSITSIGERAFAACSGLTSIVVEEGNTVYDSRENCNAIVETTTNKLLFGCQTTIIPVGVTSIGDYAFNNHSRLASISIPASVINIGANAFDGTALLKRNYNYEDGVLYIDNCLIATNYDLPEGDFQVKEGTRVIAGNAFRWRDITSISIPESVQSIGAQAFAYCRNLQVINLPSSITNVAPFTFSSCVALDTVYMLPNTPPALDLLAFDNANQPVCVVPCGSLTAYEASLWAENARHFVELCEAELIYTSTDGNIVVPYSANFDAKILSNTYADGRGRILFSNQISRIGEGAFEYCSNLKSITIPESVKTIGYGAFRRCAALEKVVIPSNATNPDGFIFESCTALKAIEAPASFFDVPSGDLAYQTRLLTHVKVNNGELTDDAWIFINRSQNTLRIVDIQAVTNTELGDKAFMGCYMLDSLYLPLNLEKISYMSVADCKHLKSIIIPATVTEIGEGALENCRLLSEVNFAENGALTNISNWAFYNCHELKNIVIPEGVTNIGYAAFYGCTYLKELTLPASMQSVADNGFALCEKLAKMNVNAVVPPVVEARTFENVDRMIPVVVPTESVSAYKAAPVWQEFNIQGKDPVMSDVENIGSDNGYGVMGNGKILRNGQLIIIRDGVEYNVTGQQF